MTAFTKRLWKNESVKTYIVIGLIVLAVFGFWFGSQLVLHTKITPVLAVVSGSMCIPYDAACDGWSHPFVRTLHVGDIVVIQGVNPQDLKADYPNSDIIVFQRPDLPVDSPNANIVHRIVSEVEVDGKLYFYTKGDGNNSPNTWPNTPQPTDYWFPDPANPNSTYNGAISQDYVYGKVVMRIPWIGQIPMFIHSVLGANSSLIVIPIIFVLIIILIVFEFAAPLLKRRKNRTPKKSILGDSSLSGKY